MHPSKEPELAINCADQSPDERGMYKEFFKIIDGALSPDFCREVIQRFEACDYKERGKVGNNTREGLFDPRYKNTLELYPSQHPKDWGDVLNHVVGNLKTNLADFMSDYHDAFPVPLYPEEFRVTKYPIGGHFNWHSDNIGSDVTRVLTVMYYLNTVEEGGETDYEWQELKIKPVEGRMAICPVGWPFRHCSRPTVSNPKYIIITQLHQKLN